MYDLARRHHLDVADSAGGIGDIASVTYGNGLFVAVASTSRTGDDLA